MKEKKKTKKKKKNTHTFIIKDPPCHFIIYGKQAAYFKFLKRFIDIPFIKTVQRRSF